jgi:hypothetical protein
VTGDESWFVYLYLSDHMFTFGRENVISKKADNWGAQDYADIIFSETSLISLDTLPYDQTYTQKYFVENILPTL